jgi:DNA polymerase-3 subunit gamma/tau
MFRILVSEQEDLSWAPQPFTVLEMAIVRLASLPEAGDIAQLIARLDALEQKLAGTGAGGPATGSGGGNAPRSSRDAPPGGRSGASEAVKSAPQRSTPHQSTARQDVVPRPNGRPAGVGTDTHDSDPKEDGALQAAEAMATPEAVLDRLRAMAREQNPQLFRSLAAVELTERSATHLHFAADGDFFAKRLEDRREELEALCQRFFGKPMKVVISQSEATSKARSESARSVANRERDRERRQAALNHPSINLVLKEMRGEIIEIRALDGPKGGFA